jgi:hypothetical protein
MFPSEDGTLREARDWLRERVDEGTACPCCTQLAKVYRRNLNSGMAHSLIAVWRVGGDGWVHLPTQIDARSREEGKLKYWGLLEEDRDKREDGGRAGWWRVTPLGLAFLRHEIQVPKYARVYDGRCLGLVGDPVWITDALGARFNYADLMAGV